MSQDTNSRDDSLFFSTGRSSKKSVSEVMIMSSYEELDAFKLWLIPEYERGKAEIN